MKKNIQSAGDILKELGFNPQAPQSAQAALIKNLIKQAYHVDVEIPEIYQASLSRAEKQKETKEALSEPIQLDFFIPEKKASNN